MKKFLLNLTFTTLLLSVAYSQCDESNWESYYPDMQGCDLSEADLAGANLYGANLSGAILTWANLEGVYLAGAYLSGANLYEATLYGANLTWADLAGAYLEGACLEGAIGFTQTNYFGTPILEGCAFGGGDCSFEDTDADGYDDVSFEEGYILGSTSGDMNLDGEVNIVDIVIHVNLVLYGE